MMFVYSSLCCAQNTSGVVGATVKEGESSLQYRLGIDPKGSNGETKFAQRLHFQKSINGALRWRLVGALKKTDASDFDFDYVQAGLVWQITEDGPDYQTGLRFDARLRDNARPGQLGVNWAHQWQMSESWRLRAVAKSSVQIGHNASQALSIESQAEIIKKLPNGRAFGVEMFSKYSTTKDVLGFDDQSHVAGPFISTPIAAQTKLSSGVLFGLTKASPDTQLKFWLTRSF